MENIKNSSKKNATVVQEQQMVKEAVKLEEEIEIVQPKQAVLAIELPIDLENPDNSWFNYGYQTFKLLLRDLKGKRYDNKKSKVITHNKGFVDIVSREYVLYPHEEVDRLVNVLVEAPESKLRLMDVKESKDGRTKYWILISEHYKFNIKDSFYGNNDQVNIGVIIRNGIGNGVALGADLFTFRAVCQNGAIFGRNNLDESYIRHYGHNFPKMVAKMSDLITSTIGRADEISELYNKMAATKINSDKLIFKKAMEVIPEKYLPDYIGVENHEVPNAKNSEGKPIKEKVLTWLNASKKNITLWEVFNDFTYKIWHEDKIKFASKKAMTKEIHKLAIDALQRYSKKSGNDKATSAA